MLLLEGQARLVEVGPAISRTYVLLCDGVADYFGSQRKGLVQLLVGLMVVFYNGVF